LPWSALQGVDYDPRARPKTSSSWRRRSTPGRPALVAEVLPELARW